MQSLIFGGITFFGGARLNEYTHASHLPLENSDNILGAQQNLAGQCP